MTKPLADILRELESKQRVWALGYQPPFTSTLDDTDSPPDNFIANVKGAFVSMGSNIKVTDTPNLLPALKLAVEALDNISDGISPLGGITSPDGHRRRMAHEALAQITQLLQDGEK